MTPTTFTGKNVHFHFKVPTGDGEEFGYINPEEVSTRRPSPIWTISQQDNGIWDRTYVVTMYTLVKN